MQTPPEEKTRPSLEDFRTLIEGPDPETYSDVLKDVGVEKSTIRRMIRKIPILGTLVLSPEEEKNQFYEEKYKTFMKLAPTEHAEGVKDAFEEKFGNDREIVQLMGELIFRFEKSYSPFIEGFMNYVLENQFDEDLLKTSCRILRQSSANANLPLAGISYAWAIPAIRKNPHYFFEIFERVAQKSIANRPRMPGNGGAEAFYRLVDGTRMAKLFQNEEEYETDINLFETFSASAIKAGAEAPIALAESKDVCEKDNDRCKTLAGAIVLLVDTGEQREAPHALAAAQKVFGDNFEHLPEVVEELIQTNEAFPTEGLAASTYLDSLYEGDFEKFKQAQEEVRRIGRSKSKLGDYHLFVRAIVVESIRCKNITDFQIANDYFLRAGNRFPRLQEGGEQIDIFERYKTTRKLKLSDRATADFDLERMLEKYKRQALR